MPASWQTADARTSLDDITKAREAAEVLFKPRQSIVPPKAPIEVISAPPAAEEAPARKPRILAARPPIPAREEPIERDTTALRKPKRVVPTRRVKNIPASHHGRIRTLATYGMTHEQLAELYDVPVSEIEEIAGAG